MVFGGIRPHAFEQRDRGGADEASVLMKRGRRGRSGLLFHNHLSFNSTVKTLFSNLAGLGDSVAMDMGSPMWRRRVPISTTSSSPFLKSPTSPLTANGSCKRTS